MRVHSAASVKEEGGTGWSLPGSNHYYWPVPLSVTLCGLFAALSENLRVELRPFLLVGVNVTLTVHDVPWANPAPPIGHVLAWMAKSPEFPPAMVMLEKISAEPPELVTVTICGALVVPTLCAGNVNDAGDSVTAGPAIPVPVSDTV